MFCLWFLTSWEDRVMLSISASGFFWTLFNKVLPWKGCDAWVRFCQVCAQATRDMPDRDWHGAVVGWAGSSPGAAEWAGGSGQAWLCSGEHLCPSQGTFSAPALELWPALSLCSSGAQRRCLSSPSTASSRPACPKWQLTGAPWVPTALAAALIPAGCALSPQNRTGWDMRAPEAAGNFPSLW